jgi:hypothetical protein
LQEWPAINVEELDDAAEVAQASAETVRRAVQAQLSVYLVANGGTKMTTHGLRRPWAEVSPLPKLIWGEQPAAAYRTYQFTLDGPPTVCRYETHKLDLPDVLIASGHRIGEGVKFWPGPLAASLEAEPYGADTTATTELHRTHHLRAEWCEGEPLPDYRLASRCAPEVIQRWKQSLLAPLRKYGLDTSVVADGDFESIYNQTLGAARRGQEARAQAARSSVDRIGPPFERAVARRVHAWLERRQHPAVQSAWRDVEVFREGDTERSAQLDVVLVLKNGLLLHLECKTFTADLKDLNARLYILQQAGSLGARMVVCAPVLTEFADEEWFTDQHKRRLWFEARRHLGFVPFTLPRQRLGYTVEQGGVSQAYACPEMESALEAALKAFLPR